MDIIELRLILHDLSIFNYLCHITNNIRLCILNFDTNDGIRLPTMSIYERNQISHFTKHALSNSISIQQLKTTFGSEFND